MFGAVKFEEFETCRLPQKAASAWGEMLKLVGASYKPVLFVGTQITRGTNYIFIAEKKTITATPHKTLVIVTINDFEGKYEIVDVETLV